MPEGVMGFIVALAIAVVVVLSYDTGRGAAARDCDKLGAFAHSGAIYECRKK